MGTWKTLFLAGIVNEEQFNPATLKIQTPLLDHDSMKRSVIGLALDHPSFSLMVLTFTAVLGTIWLLYVYKNRVRSTYVLSRSPFLPLSYVSEGDDVWIRGKVHCDTPFYPPHTKILSCYYHVLEEEYVEDSWKTVGESSKGCPFTLHDRDSSITVDARHVMFYQLPFSQLRISEPMKAQRRYTISFIPLELNFSVHGWVDRQKERLVTHDHIQLVGTPLYPDELCTHLKEGNRLFRIYVHLAFWISSFLLYLLGACFHTYGLHGCSMNMMLSHTPIPLLLSCITLFCFWIIEAYNQIIELNMKAQNAWLMVSIDMKQRYILIPKLQEVTQWAKDCEQSTFVLASELRQLLSTDIAKRVIEKEDAMYHGIESLLALDESHPELKSNEHFTSLKQAILSIEEKIAQGRAYFNDCVAEYNRQLLSFPHSIVAFLADYEDIAYFSAQDEFNGSRSHDTEHVPLHHEQK